MEAARDRGITGICAADPDAPFFASETCEDNEPCKSKT